jgi:hypothetical protein
LDGVEGQKCPQLGLAGLVFTEVMQREVHAQRIDRVELPAARGAHASPQPSYVVIAGQPRCRSTGEYGANTRDEAWRGRFRRRAGKAWPR